MADSAAAQRWIGQAGFAALILSLMFFRLLPLDTLPPRWAAPDLILCVTLVWTVRRSDLVPVWVVALLFLLTDLMFGRPPGLWTALVLILTEMLRARAADLRSASFLVEWMTIAGGVTLATLADRAVLGVVITPQAPLGLTLLQMVATILTYPAVVAVAKIVFGVSHPAPGEVNARGQKI